MCVRGMGEGRRDVGGEVNMGGVIREVRGGQGGGGERCRGGEVE